MIAFNKLLENIDEYSHIYELMGVKENLTPFVELENKRKDIQLKLESARAKCNKLCSQMADLRKSGKDTAPLLKEIKELEYLMKVLQGQLDFYGRRIDDKLKLLHNIPDKYNELNLQIETSKKATSDAELAVMLKSFMPSKHSIRSIKGYIKSQKNKLFEESDLPVCTFTRTGITILTTDTAVDDVMKKLLDFFLKNSLNMVCVSFKGMKKSSCQEYMVELRKSKYLRLELKREFFTREFKIKYKNKKEDMTKFVNQIDIKYL